MEQITVAQLLDSLKDVNTLAVPIVAAAVGALGGLAYKLTSPEDKGSLIKNLIVGAVAAVAILFVFTPTDAIKFISLSLIAGYAGEAILNALGARVEAAIARQEKVQAETRAKDAVETGKLAVNQARKLNEIINKNQNLPDLSVDLQSLVNKTPDDLNIELNGLSQKLDFLDESLGK